MSNRRNSGVRRAAITSSALVVVMWGACTPMAAADEPVETGIVDGAVVSVGSPPVRGTEVVAVGVPPVPPGVEVVAVGVPPVPPGVEVVAVGVPPVPPGVEVVAVGVPPVPPGVEVVAVGVPPVPPPSNHSGARRAAHTVAAPDAAPRVDDGAVAAMFSPVVATVGAGLELIDESL